MKFLFQRGLGSFLVLAVLAAGFLSVGEAAHGQTILLKEGASITAIKTSSGDITTRADSYFNAVSQAFSQKACSALKLQQTDNANFTVVFYVAHLLEQYTISYVVVNKSGSVISTSSSNSIPEAVEKICELIKPPTESRIPKCLPNVKGAKGRACEDWPGKKAPKGVSYY
jgi:hypothetical protein